LKSPNDIEVFEYTILEQLNLRICVLEDESAIKDNEIARLKAEIEELKLRLDKR